MSEKINKPNYLKRQTWSNTILPQMHCSVNHVNTAAAGEIGVKTIVWRVLWHS